jgi:hydrogenase maturation protease
MSLHQSSFQEVLSLAQFSGHTPEKAVLVGVQPKLLKDFGGSLTDVVREKLPEALAIGLGFLAEWGVPGTPRQPGDAVPLFDPSLAIGNYESGRPSADDACRIGDERLLALRASLER